MGQTVKLLYTDADDTSYCTQGKCINTCDVIMLGETQKNNCNTENEKNDAFVMVPSKKNKKKNNAEAERKRD
jgi:hypothetical protein